MGDHEVQQGRMGVGHGASAGSSSSGETVPRVRHSSGVAEQTLELIDRYWRAATYLSVRQVYLLDNSKLREALRAEHASRAASMHTVEGCT